MEKITLTTLRQDLFRIADRVLETGAPVTITRKGKTLLLATDTQGATLKLSRLKRRKLFRGSAESLVNARAGKWREPKNLK